MKLLILGSSLFFLTVACSGGSSDSASTPDIRPTADVVSSTEEGPTEVADTCRFNPPEDFSKVNGYLDWGSEGNGQGIGVRFSYIRADGDKVIIDVPPCARNQAIAAYRRLNRWH